MMDRAEFEVLEARLKTLLPPEYRDSYQEVRSVSMGSAGLKFSADGRVAWNEMWGSFCDLAMAGGPPHKGKLLEPGSPESIAADGLRYGQVVDEICRGIAMVTGLPVEASPVPGWVRVTCRNHAMAGWLLRAITMENVAVRSCEGATIDLPAAPGYRLEKEIKNVIAVIAKTCHYWVGHIPLTQQRTISDLFEAIDISLPLLQPMGGVSWKISECADVAEAVWMMRLLVAGNVLSRREGTALFVPVDEVRDPTGAMVAGRLRKVHAWAVERDVVPMP